MKKFVGIILIAIFAMSFVAGAMVSPTEAKQTQNCDWKCRKTYWYYCCYEANAEPSCTIVGRCL